MKLRATYQKTRGGYYTPAPIAEFLSAWAIRSPRDRILEPSCGDGAFVETAAKRLLSLGTEHRNVPSQLLAYEIDAQEAALATDRLETVIGMKAGRTIQAADFFSRAAVWNGNGQFDAVIGNPPFVRYQHFPEEQRTPAFEVMRSCGLRPNGLTNAWVPFIVAAAGLLTPTGRLAMVAPAELLQVGYAAELRLFLARSFDQLRVITFRGLPFPGIQQEVVLLLALKKSAKTRGIDLLQLDNAHDLFADASSAFGSNGLRVINHDTEKWTQYYLSTDENKLLRELRSDPRLTRFGDIAETDVGVVTGMNDVFSLSAAEIEEYRLTEFTSRLVSRSAHLTGTDFRDKDWLANSESGNKVFVLNIPAVEEKELPADLIKYLNRAKKSGFHLGYKCRIRRHWYSVPSIYIPDAFMLRQIHHFPKLVINAAHATSTDTIHRVRFKTNINRQMVASAFLNSLTFAFSEILGRSYGGGVLELEPNEANALPVPLLGAKRLNERKIDLQIRSSMIESVLDETDKILLADGLGLSKRQIKMLRSIWIKLRTRRTGRKNGSK